MAGDEASGNLETVQTGFSVCIVCTAQPSIIPVVGARAVDRADRNTGLSQRSSHNLDEKGR